MLDSTKVFDQILSKSETSFISLFEKEWRKHLKSLPEKYRRAKQLIVGQRYRPILVAWGYALAHKEITGLTFESIAKQAIYIELIHKATLLIDDLIDNDETRHGEVAFHIEYSSEEAIILGLHLIADSYQQLSTNNNGLLGDQNINHLGRDLFLQLKNMTHGVLLELNLEKADFRSINKMKELIELQTVPLIKNSLLTGFRIANGLNSAEKFLEKIGYDLGYIFQLLNDLEPFSSKYLIKAHKGNFNTDFTKRRKNIIVAFILHSLNIEEFDKNYDKTNPELLESFLLSKYEENQIISKVHSNLIDVISNLKRCFNKLEPLLNSTLFMEFKYFVNGVFIKGIERLDKNNHPKLLEILRI